MSTCGSRPSSITRSLRNNFTAEMELLPPEHEDDVEIFEFCEEDDNLSNPGNEKATEDESKNSDFDSKKENNVDIDPKITKGMEKIRKLDKILLTKLEREKEVKKERRALEKKFLKQVQTLVDTKGSENVIGYQQLLSLCAPVDRAEVDRADHNENENAQPIFATQLDTDFGQEHVHVEGVRTTDKANKTETVHCSKPENSKKTYKDFVKRNIKLASLASEPTKLTDEERERLEQLLTDDIDLLIGDNPFSTPSLTTDGFRFSVDEQKALEDIDEKLKDYLPSEEYEAILNESQSSFTMPQQSNNPTDVYEKDATNVFTQDAVECGEKVLREGHQNRTMLQRLSDIEAKLRALNNGSVVEEDETIDPDLLRQLLDTNSRLTSTSKSICESFCSNSVVYDDELFDLQSIDSNSTKPL